MTDMVERVAREVKLGRLRGAGDVEIARAALKAIREPTKEMVDTVIFHVENWDELPVNREDQARGLLEALVDIALKDPDQ